LNNRFSDAKQTPLFVKLKSGMGLEKFSRNPSLFCLRKVTIAPGMEIRSNARFSLFEVTQTSLNKIGLYQFLKY
jgi:hypothetical protein